MKQILSVFLTLLIACTLACCNQTSAPPQDAAQDTALAAMADTLIGSEQQFVNYNS